ncbi:MAG TPA: family 43 glycosylhydrolase [Candidatus Marinimicrobia bacterium]|nr:family 43 glycosylhydrolase [Candidatus Neomarinimicrobiota bacterium]HRS51716.1 family 43 glycosylhydrolase [Candidatus Neomarinimicrobiota bacterium]HRU92134.1 family 43 glycosylhydrolase [Candidatus Neomarinimicrobiota bacterium]
MKNRFKVIIILSIVQLFLQLANNANAQYQKSSIDVKKGYYLNPIFSGDYPDPSILKDGDDYYLVNSSFDYYPGLLIWHSKDLINWSPVTNALYQCVGSVWAPDLVKYRGKYYIYFPVPDKQTNYVVYADSIKGPWSVPINLKVSHIDPGHFVDENGKRYLYFSSGDYIPLSDDGLSVVGDFTHAYDGWPIPRDWTIELFALEGPKVTKRGDYYYLTVAEGGTAGPATGHMIISARSKSPFGPWENSPFNPIIRASSKEERWWSKGHGTLFEDTEGDWWIIFHSYEKDYLNMGRQILLEPVEWTNDGWFRTPNIKTDKPIKKPYEKVVHSTYTLNDDFSGPELKHHWKFFQEYDTSRFYFANNCLIIKGKSQSVEGSSPLLCIPSDHSYTAEVELTIKGDAIGGLVLFYNDNYHSGILADDKNILADLRGWQFPTEKNVIARHVFLKLKNIENTVDMYYSKDGKDWNKIETSAEVSGFNHNALSGFLSLRIGLCSIGDGEVAFKNFKYEPINK